MPSRLTIGIHEIKGRADIFCQPLFIFRTSEPVRVADFEDTLRAQSDLDVSGILLPDVHTQQGDMDGRTSPEAAGCSGILVVTALEIEGCPHMNRTVQRELFVAFVGDAVMHLQVQIVVLPRNRIPLFAFTVKAFQVTDVAEGVGTRTAETMQTGEIVVVFEVERPDEKAFQIPRIGDFATGIVGVVAVRQQIASGQ